ncbi:RidA family protein [Gaopeijia maritima]|uniref:RidA family protein n=1 Tax=Gaopeijia maritima TaxID=3119007 RepID=A0ABU9E5E3_9BACT
MTENRDIRSVATSDAPTPAGHYSQAVVHAGAVWVAGQMPFDPANREAPLGDVEAQVRRTFANVEAVLIAAGSSLDRLLQVTIFVTDPELWGEINRVYADILGDHRPARAVIPCGPLKRGAVLEVTAVAAVAVG